MIVPSASLGTPAKWCLKSFKRLKPQAENIIAKEQAGFSGEQVTNRTLNTFPSEEYEWNLIEELCLGLIFHCLEQYH